MLIISKTPYKIVLKTEKNDSGGYGSFLAAGFIIFTLATGWVNDPLYYVLVSFILIVIILAFMSSVYAEILTFDKNQESFIYEKQSLLPWKKVKKYSLSIIEKIKVTERIEKTRKKTYNVTLVSYRFSMNLTSSKDNGLSSQERLAKELADFLKVPFDKTTEVVEDDDDDD